MDHNPFFYFDLWIPEMTDLIESIQDEPTQEDFEHYDWTFTDAMANVTLAVYLNSELYQDILQYVDAFAELFAEYNSNLQAGVVPNGATREKRDSGGDWVGEWERLANGMEETIRYYTENGFNLKDCLVRDEKAPELMAACRAQAMVSFDENNHG